MEKKKRWQFALIIAVIVLTIYNILPTIFYYTKPLKESINQRQAAEVGLHISKRVNILESESKEWLEAFAGNLGVIPEKISSVEVGHVRLLTCQ